MTQLPCNTPDVSLIVQMDKPLRFRYWKWIDNSEGKQSNEVKGIFREPLGKNALTQFWLGEWRSATEYVLRMWDDPNFVQIEESEANELIPKLLKAQELGASQGITEPVFEPMSTGEQQDQPLSSMTTAAIAMHELYLSFKAAGFDEDQSLKLVAEIIRRPKEPSE